MNKTAIKNFAVWARNKLIADITYKAGLMGVTDKGISAPQPQSTGDKQFFDIGTGALYSITGKESEQRKQLAKIITDKAKHSGYIIAFNAVVEEVAYTWFNRLIAVRFMEVNDYLPSRVRVLSSESNGKTEPDLVTAPFDADLNFNSKEKVLIAELKLENKLDELFRLLFIKQCNALNTILPKLFEKTNDYTELLLNISYTDKEGVVAHLVNDIDEDDFRDQVQIIGWLYQYYNTEPKDETFALLKKNVKITKERIPAATQLFTPDWIVRYMVENSLGRLWLEGHTNDELKAKWKYYLEEAEQPQEVRTQLKQISVERRRLMPEDITFIDPCMGSGHILAYAFDVFMQIYESAGYSQRDAARLILEKNLYGLDIDKRAYQLAYFSLIMKARQYNRRILETSIKINIGEIQESGEIGKFYNYHVDDFMLDKTLSTTHQETIRYILSAFMDAKEYGSLLQLETHDYLGLMDAWKYTASQTTGIFNLTLWYSAVEKDIPLLIEQAIMLTQKYDVVVTNPPYMGSSGMNGKLAEFVKKEYPDGKSDLFAAFIERCGEMAKQNGYQAMITQHAFMFLSSYEKLRTKLLLKNIVNMAHLGARAFEEIGGEVVQTTAFVLRKSNVKGYKSTFVRLVDFNSQQAKEEAFLSGGHRHIAQKENFAKIPGSPMAYWVESVFINVFEKSETLAGKVTTRLGMATANNDLFVRTWSEVKNNRIGFGFADRKTAAMSKMKWFPYNKGGSFRRWYGNQELVVDWENDGYRIQNFKDKKTGRIRSHNYNLDYIFRNGITWSALSSAYFSARHFSEGFLFDDKGSSAFMSPSIKRYVLGYLNCIVSSKAMGILNPTISFQPGDLSDLPLIIDQNRKNVVDDLVDVCILVSRTDWDSSETSWDFKRHPLVSGAFKLSLENKLAEKHIEASYMERKRFAEEQFLQLKANEEELNRLFIDIYGLQDELTPDVAEKDVTVARIYDSKDDIPASMKGNGYVLTKADVVKSFVSYAVGCMFGRYSLDADGLAYAGGDFDSGKYSSFIPDKDNILPITDEEYYEDDIVGRFVEFVKIVYGAETLEENLEFIAASLGNKGNSSREIIRNYFVKDFFKNHCKTYQKRPIYWLFDSGKQDGFKALVYMHRYDENTIGNLRIDYLHRIQRVYDSEIARMQETIGNSKDGRAIAAAEKRKEKLIKQLKEIKDYDEKIAHLAPARIAIDLDDGVKVNYEKVQTDTDGEKLDVLGKI